MNRVYSQPHIHMAAQDAAPVKSKYAQVVVHKEIHSRTCCLLLSAAQHGRNTA